MRFRVSYQSVLILLVMTYSTINSQATDQTSCKNRCLNVYNNQFTCQCNDVCADYGNCCPDFYTEGCDETSYDSCYKRCKVDYDYEEDCQCTDECDDNNNCCSDFLTLGCPSIQDGVTTLSPSTLKQGTVTPPVMSPDSCAGRCGSEYDRTALCQCDTYCMGFGDCCDDVKTRCANLFPTETPQVTTPINIWDSCTDRCGDGLDNAYNCQCNSACETYQDCCDDYEDLCVPINFDELMTQLWAADVNRIPDQYYTTAYQGYDSDYNDHTDIAPDKLFTSFDEDYIYNQGTFTTFIELCDNYEPIESIPEDDTVADQNEVRLFLDAIFQTEVIDLTAQALIKAGEFTTKTEFRAKIKDMWFTHYNRKADYDSSGFEHVFCGEFKTTSTVSGFHNWIILHQRERDGELNYHGYNNDMHPNQLSAQFSWNGATKSRSGFLLGASPEFEFAVFTTAWVMNPNSVTSFTVTDGSDSYDFSVQAYVEEGKYVGSCYFII